MINLLLTVSSFKNSNGTGPSGYEFSYDMEKISSFFNLNLSLAKMNMAVRALIPHMCLIKFLLTSLLFPKYKTLQMY